MKYSWLERLGLNEGEPSLQPSMQFVRTPEPGKHVCVNEYSESIHIHPSVTRKAVLCIHVDNTNETSRKQYTQKKIQGRTTVDTISTPTLDNTTAFSLSLRQLFA